MMYVLYSTVQCEEEKCIAISKDCLIVCRPEDLPNAPILRNREFNKQAQVS